MRRPGAGGARRGRATARAVAACVILTGFVAAGAAQGRGGAGQEPAQPPPTPQAGAPIDLTGTWVSIVNEDWRWRMVTPPKGDYASVPLNAEGRKVADAWDPSKDGLCDAYGAAGVMRLPTRLNIRWENPATLRVDTDAGGQTRRFIFDAARTPAGPPSLQGHSVAEWERPAAGRGGRGSAPAGGTLKVVTTNMRGGWLRRNGVPYSASATLTEYYDRFAAPDGEEWLVVTSIVSDAKYLTADFITSTHFRKEANASAFSPTPCRAS